jgi:F0F1-type ATP synthase membrane subunit b/b'
MEPITLGVAIVALVAGVGQNLLMIKTRSKSAEGEAKKVVDSAKAKAKEITLAAKEESVKIAEEAKADERRRREKLG